MDLKELLSKLPPPDFKNEIVYRIEHEDGEGLFTGGGARYVPESYFQQTVPAEKAGFHPDVYKLLVRGIGKSACRNKDEMIRLFTPEAIKILEEKGFKLYTKKAVVGWEASGQVIFIEEK